MPVGLVFVVLGQRRDDLLVPGAAHQKRPDRHSREHRADRDELGGIGKKRGCYRGKRRDGAGDAGGHQPPARAPDRVGDRGDGIAIVVLGRQARQLRCLAPKEIRLRQ